MTASVVAEVEVPCTCGELVQGFLDGEPFLVSCPIAHYSRVTVSLGAGRFPQGLPKATLAAATTFAALGHANQEFSIRVSNSLPSSRGFGTSTADVAGAIVAAAETMGRLLRADEVARLAVSVEPSDGTMFPGLAAFNHRSGKSAVGLGAAPPLLVVVLEFEGVVDTLEFNSHLDLCYLRSREAEYGEMVRLLRQGLDEGRWRLVGRAATASARLNQWILPKPELESTIALAEGHGALGVCAAHSGTVLGVLFKPEDRERATALTLVAKESLRGVERAWLSHMVNGGARSVASRQRLLTVPGQMPGRAWTSNTAEG